MTERPGRGNHFPSDATSQGTPRPRSFATLLLLALCAALAFSGFIALGNWQVHRLYWKRALIEHVDQRVHAEPLTAPGPDQWQHINAENDEYKHVRVTGTYLYELTAKVQASTILGSGYWLLTPLRDAAGNTYIINRGFIPADAATHLDLKKTTTAAPATVTGLLRISEPGGGFLRKNDPANDRWYSRDVQAIAASRGLSNVAPYFVDADAQGKNSDPTEPVGGLTVITFNNNHLSYALTWYALALMVAGAAFWVAREEYKLRQTTKRES
jgi:surfeit locus 1 family protein